MPEGGCLSGDSSPKAGESCATPLGFLHRSRTHWPPAAVFPIVQIHDTSPYRNLSTFALEILTRQVWRCCFFVSGFALSRAYLLLNARVVNCLPAILKIVHQAPSFRSALIATPEAPRRPSFLERNVCGSLGTSPQRYSLMLSRRPVPSTERRYLHLRLTACCKCGLSRFRAQPFQTSCPST